MKKIEKQSKKNPKLAKKEKPKANGTNTQSFDDGGESGGDHPKKPNG
jgi:hypothetical protein